jgi:hypothetical protein
MSEKYHPAVILLRQMPKYPGAAMITWRARVDAYLATVYADVDGDLSDAARAELERFVREDGTLNYDAMDAEAITITLDELRGDGQS